MLRLEGTATMARADADSGVSIDLLRWSTDEEMESLASAIANGVEGVDGWLDDGETLGYLWTAESVGYAIRYAHRIADNDGGERIIFALSDPFASRNPGMWQTAQAAATQGGGGGGGRGGRGGGGGGGGGGGRGGGQGGGAQAPEPTEPQPFTLIELRLDAQGRGEARDVLTSGLGYAFGIDGFEAASALLENVGRN
jgi:hypothetical protein